VVKENLIKIEIVTIEEDIEVVIEEIEAALDLEKDKAELKEEILVEIVQEDALIAKKKVI
jgi:hypothetical protein